MRVIPSKGICFLSVLLSTTLLLSSPLLTTCVVSVSMATYDWETLADGDVRGIDFPGVNHASPDRHPFDRARTAMPTYAKRHNLRVRTRKMIVMPEDMTNATQDDVVFRLLVQFKPAGTQDHEFAPVMQIRGRFDPRRGEAHLVGLFCGGCGATKPRPGITCPVCGTE